MQLKFRIILNVKEDVLRDIVIDSATSLLEFSNIISSEFGFDSSEISTFHKTDDNWEQLEEIKIFKIDDKDEIMDNIPISNFFILKNDKLIFIYDFLNYWTFFIELHEVGEFINDDSNYDAEVPGKKDGNNLSEEILKLEELNKKGILTNEEYEKAKKKLLD